MQLYTQKYTRGVITSKYIITLVLIITVKSGILQNIRKKDDIETTKIITTGKNPNAYIQRTEVSEVQQKPEEIKFKISQVHNHC